MAAVHVTQSGNPCMTGVEHQVFELMAFVHKQMVYAHHLKVHNIILTVFNIVLQRFQLYFKIFFPLDYPGEHSPCHFLALRFQGIEIALYAVQFYFEDFLLYFGRLRYHSELVVRKYHAIPIIIFNIPENPQAFFRRKIINTWIKDFGVWIGFTVVFGNGRYICFQPDNHRLMG